MALFEIKDVDRDFYANRLKDFLPDRIIDAHTHIWKSQHVPVETAAERLVTWPWRVASVNPAEHLAESYRLMFPGKQVSAVVFGSPAIQDDLDAQNAYVDAEADARGWASLLLATPEWSPDELETRLLAGNFVGIKVYLSFAPPHIASDDIGIFDFLPHAQLAVLDRLGLAVMLHIPRSGRLRDRGNLEQMLEIEQRYPNVKVIIAHVGRAYCDEDVGDAFDVLAPTKNMLFDFSANTNATVFQQLIEAVGPTRILFGSDMPIVRMRMHRIQENGRYINVVPDGLYGDVSADPNMRTVSGSEAERLSFFLYEEIDAFRCAAGKAGLNREEISNIFYGNAASMLDGIRASKAVAR